MTSPNESEYLPIPYADLRRPPITLPELERARTLLTAKGELQPTEDQIFATTEKQRQIELKAFSRSRKARRSVERRPLHRALSKPNRAVEVDYGTQIIPYSGEEW